MTVLPSPISRLTAALGELPGIGPRSAERLAIHIVLSESKAVSELAQALLEAREKIHPCSVCGGLTEKQPCDICADPKRDASLLCLVEKAVDIISIEKSGTFRGKYHVLGGKISPINGIGPEDLRCAALGERLQKEPVRELIVALPSDVEGDATSFYIARQFARENLSITRIAQGLPVGAGLEFADGLTLGRAIEGRNRLPSC